MFSFELVTFTSFQGGPVRLNIFSAFVTLFPGRETLWRFEEIAGSSDSERIKRPCRFNPIQAMRIKFFVFPLVALAFAGSAFAAIVVEKRSRQMPNVEVFDCQGVHSFVFRGPKGTNRPPILVHPRECWEPREAGQYKFWLKDGSGHVCSRLVTPAVFARYQVGDDFNPCAPWTERTTEDSKTVHPVHHRKHTAQVRKRSSQRQIAKHHRNHRSTRLAGR